MEELKALQKKLVDIQKSGGGFKLSERTVVGIVQKIMARGKIKLMHTITGKEYVAEEKITKEITDEVKRYQGRISKVDLVKLLEVSSNVIDSKISQLLSKDKSLHLIEGKLITNYYLDNMCSEINEMLKLTGCIFLSDLSTKFDLSIDYFKRFLKDKSSQINAKLYETRLLTDDYIAYQKQRIRPILIASTTPLQLSNVIDNYQLDELIVEDLIRNLIDSGVVKGKFSGNTFEPSIFFESQASYVKGLLNQNNYIEYSALKNVGITKNAIDYIKDLQKRESSFQDGVYLTEYFISSGLKTNFEYIFFDNLAKGSPTNLASIFIFNLQDEDTAILLDSINVKVNTVYSLNMNLIPCELVENFLQTISPKLKEEASKQYNSFVTKLKEKEKKKSAEVADTKKKGKGSKGKSKAKNEDEEEEENDVSIQILPQFKKEIEGLFAKCFDDVNDRNETVAQLFEGQVMKKINSLYSQFVTEFIKTKSQSSANNSKDLVSLVDNEFHELKFTQKSLDVLSKVSNDSNLQSSIKAIIAHICKKDLVNLFKNILTYQLIHMKSKIDLNKINDPNQRKEIINSLNDPDLKDIFNSLNDSLQNKNLASFIKTLEENSKFMAITLSPSDKKREKLISEKYVKEWSLLIEEKSNNLGRTGKKDYLALTVDLCQNILIKKGFLVKLPYETWAIGIFANLIPELKGLLTSLGEMLNCDDDTFEFKREMAQELLNKIINS